ncbi:hypothetical protein D3C71_1877230 [compost metagenome]
MAEVAAVFKRLAISGGLFAPDQRARLSAKGAATVSVREAVDAATGIEAEPRRAAGSTDPPGMRICSAASRTARRVASDMRFASIRARA